MKNNNQIYRLMRKYSTTVIISFVVFIVAVFSQAVIEAYTSAEKKMEYITQMSYNTFNTDYFMMTDISRKMVETEQQISNYTKLFELTYSEYLSETLIDSSEKEEPYLPNQIKSHLAMYDNIDMIVIELIDQDGMYYSTRQHPRGSWIDTYPEIESNYQIQKDLIDTFNFNVFGRVTFHLKDETFSNLNHLLDASNNFETYIVDGSANLMYSTSGDELYYQFAEVKDINQTFTSFLASKGYSYSEIRGPNGFRIVTFAPTLSMFFMVNKLTAIWMFLALALIAILLLSFNHIFKNYVGQVEDVVDSMKKINFNDRQQRISLENKEGEFLLITETLNDMLDNIESYINEIYILEYRQKEAELSALQAQINPHFLYNTLEYIRMNVMSEGLTDLSAVVFSFASLLRNNISSEKTIPLKKELDFCEKYVFLYQIRHPEHIAYSFNVTKEVENMIVPRFILQPIIENYLIHGLDYERIDNAVKVDAQRINDDYVIIISDNGKGMSDEKLESVQKALSNHDAVYGNDSIGFMNVNDRLMHFYSGRAEMTIERNKQKGITVKIVIKGESK